MSRLAYDFFSQSPMLLLPLAALLIFFIVFVAIVYRVYRMKTADVDRFARLPLDEGSEDQHG